MSFLIDNVSYNNSNYHCWYNSNHINPPLFCQILFLVGWHIFCEFQFYRVNTVDSKIAVCFQLNFLVVDIRSGHIQNNWLVVNDFSKGSIVWIDKQDMFYFLIILVNSKIVDLVLLMWWIVEDDTSTYWVKIEWRW